MSTSISIGCTAVLVADGQSEQWPVELRNCIVNLRIPLPAFEKITEDLEVQRQRQASLASDAMSNHSSRSITDVLTKCIMESIADQQTQAGISRSESRGSIDPKDVDFSKSRIHHQGFSTIPQDDSIQLLLSLRINDSTSRTFDARINLTEYPLQPLNIQLKDVSNSKMLLRKTLEACSFEDSEQMKSKRVDEGPSPQSRHISSYTHLLRILATRWMSREAVMEQITQAMTADPIQLDRVSFTLDDLTVSDTKNFHVKGTLDCVHHGHRSVESHSRIDVDAHLQQDSKGLHLLEDQCQVKRTIETIGVGDNGSAGESEESSKDTSTDTFTDSSGDSSTDTLTGHE